MVRQAVRARGQPRQHPARGSDPARDAPPRPPRRHAEGDPARRNSPRRRPDVSWDEVRAGRLARATSRAGAGGTAGRGRPRRLRDPRAGDGLGRAPACSAGRGDHPGRRAGGALGAADDREDVDDCAARSTSTPPTSSRSGPRRGARSSERGPDVELVTAIGDALRAGPLTREQLADAVLERVPSAPRDELASGWGFHLERRGGCRRALLRSTRGREGDVRARRRLARAAAASGSPRRHCRRSRAATRPPTRPPACGNFASGSLAKVDVDVPDFVAPTAGAGGSVRLLPEYDLYVMGFREREHLVPPEVREQIAAHGKGRYEGPAGTPFLARRRLCARGSGAGRSRRSGSS